MIIKQELKLLCYGLWLTDSCIVCPPHYQLWSFDSVVLHWSRFKTYVTSEKVKWLRMILTEFFVFAALWLCMKLESSWNVMAHGDAREGKWSGNWRMEWVASTLHTTSEHGVSSITTADAHNSAASSRLNWRPCRFKWTRPFRRKTKSASSACAVAFQTQSTTGCCAIFFKFYFRGYAVGLFVEALRIRAGKFVGSIFDLGFFKYLILPAALFPCGRLNL